MLALAAPSLARAQCSPPPPPPTGGQSDGPGDIPVPPPGKTGPPSASQPPTPSSPAPAGPTTGAPAPVIPVTGGASPASPSSPVGGLGPQPGPASSPASADDLSSWSYWWYFNREELLDLRRRFRDSGSLTGQVPGAPIPTRPSDRALTNTVLPALFSMASEDEPDSVRLSADIALARIATPARERILTTGLELATERDPGLREGAALALGINGDPRLLDELVALVEGGKPAKELLGYKPNDRVRAFAAYGLAVAAHRAPNDDVRRVILRPVLERFLDTSEGTDLRVALVSALGMMRIEFGPAGSAVVRSKGRPVTPRYRRELLDILWAAYESERDRLVLGHLPTALGRLLADAPNEARDDGIARLIAALDNEPRQEELAGLIDALGIVGQAWGRPADQELRRVLYGQAATQKKSHARHLALMALSQVVANSGPSLPPASVQKEFEDFLLARYDLGRATDRPWIALAAGSFGARLRKPIEGRKGARARGHVGSELIGRLRSVVQRGGSAEELSAAVLALGLCEDPSAGEDLEALFDQTGLPIVRGYAALALGLLHRTGTYPKLATAIDDLRYDPFSLENTAIGLALLDRARGSALLRDRLAHAYSGITAAPLAAVIGRVADSASVLPLAQLTKDHSQTAATREYACIALGLISDRDDISWRSSLASDVNYAAWTPTLFDTAGRGVLNIF